MSQTQRILWYQWFCASASALVIGLQPAIAAAEVILPDDADSGGQARYFSDSPYQSRRIAHDLTKSDPRYADMPEDDIPGYHISAPRVESLPMLPVTSLTPPQPVKAKSVKIAVSGDPGRMEPAAPVASVTAVAPLPWRVAAKPAPAKAPEIAVRKVESGNPVMASRLPPMFASFFSRPKPDGVAEIPPGPAAIVVANTQPAPQVVKVIAPSVNVPAALASAPAAEAKPDIQIVAADVPVLVFASPEAVGIAPVSPSDAAEIKAPVAAEMARPELQIIADVPVPVIAPPEAVNVAAMDVAGRTPSPAVETAKPEAAFAAASMRVNAPPPMETPRKDAPKMAAQAAMDVASSAQEAAHATPPVPVIAAPEAMQAELPASPAPRPVTSSAPVALPEKNPAALMPVAGGASNATNRNHVTPTYNTSFSFSLWGHHVTQPAASAVAAPADDALPVLRVSAEAMVSQMLASVRDSAPISPPVQLANAAPVREEKNRVELALATDADGNPAQQPTPDMRRRRMSVAPGISAPVPSVPVASVPDTPTPVIQPPGVLLSSSMPEGVLPPETTPSLSAQSKHIIDSLPPEREPANVNRPPIHLDHAHKNALEQDTATETHEHEGVGVSIKVKRPNANISQMLESAYNALITGNQEEAIATYRDVLSMEPGNKLALFGLATTYHRAGQIALARPLYGKLLAIDPGNVEGLNNFLVLLADEAPEQALVELQKLERTHPHFSPIPAQIASIYEKAGDYDHAARNLKLALELSPENIKYRYNMAIVLDKAGAWDDAAVFYQQLLTDADRGEKLPTSPDEIQERLTFIRSNRPKRSF